MRLGRRVARSRTREPAHRRYTLARLQRVNTALSQWDEYDCAETMPADLAPQLDPPTLSRAALKELQAMLVAIVGELDEVWERRDWWRTDPATLTDVDLTAVEMARCL